MGGRRLALPNLSGVLNKIRLETWFGKGTLFFYLCAVVMVASLALGGGRGARFIVGCHSPAASHSASPRLSLEAFRGFLDEADATGVVVLLCNRRPSPASADSAAAVALDGIAEPATLSRGI